MHSWQRWTVRLGSEFESRTGFTLSQLNDIEIHYVERSIEKKRGGTRTLHVPAEPLKNAQRAIAQHVLRKLPCHYAAVGFVSGRSIVDHAARHVGRKVVVGLDIADFFPSTRAERIRDSLLFFGWREDLVQTVVRLCCEPLRQGLPQGAPTSPMLSNIVNYMMDYRLTRLAQSLCASYSRYADDITFSLDDKACSFINNAARVVGAVVGEYSYVLNPHKTRVQRSGGRQVVTGLVVNNAVALPRRLRRSIRAALHSDKEGRSVTQVTRDQRGLPMTKAQLRGWLAFNTMVKQRYGSAILEHEQWGQLEQLRALERSRKESEDVLRYLGVETPASDAENSEENF